MPIYSPEIFCQNDLAAAREIVLTDEAGVSSSSRWERETPWLLSLIEPHLNPSDVIVDFGCGVGRFSQPLCAKGYATIGVDASPQMREHAMSQTASAHFEAISPDELDVRIEKGFLADIVLAIWVLQHVPDLKLELSRIQRVLKPGGSWMWGCRGSAALRLPSASGQRTLRCISLC